LKRNILSTEVRVHIISITLYNVWASLTYIALFFLK